MTSLLPEPWPRYCSSGSIDILVKLQFRVLELFNKRWALFQEELYLLSYFRPLVTNLRYGFKRMVLHVYCSKFLLADESWRHDPRRPPYCFHSQLRMHCNVWLAERSRAPAFWFIVMYDLLRAHVHLHCDVIIGTVFLSIVRGDDRKFDIKTPCKRDEKNVTWKRKAYRF